jgi:hypothetical protein
MKETIEKFIDEIYGTHEFASVSKTLLRKMMLSTLNPNKIDGGRMEKMFLERYSFNWDNTQVKEMTKQYNSTIEDHQVLQPLPSVDELKEEVYKLTNSLSHTECEVISKHFYSKYSTPKSELQPLPSEMPKEFRNILQDYYTLKTSTREHDVWQEFRNHYGTPTKKELVSDQDLSDEIYDLAWHELTPKECDKLAEYLVRKYSLNPPKREWWMDLKEGDKFMCSLSHEGVETLHHIETEPRFYISEDTCFTLNHCTPYHEPSIHDKVKDKLGIELYEEFMKEVKG